MRFTGGFALLAAAVVMASVCDAAERSASAAAVSKSAVAEDAADLAVPQGGQSPASSAIRVTPDVALTAANDFLAALKSKDGTKLRAATVLPFSYRSMGKKKLCEGVAKDDSSLDSLLRCFVNRETVFLGALQHGEDLVPKVVDAEHAPKSLLKLLDDAGREQTLVTGFINGDGVTYIILLPIAAKGAGKSGVSSMALKASFPE